MQNMNVNAASSTYGEHESKLTAAPHEESCASKSKVVKPLPLMVEIEPARPEAVCAFFLMLFPLENVLYQCDSDYLAVHVQAQPQSKEIQCLLPATPNSQSTFGQQVLKPIAAPHMISACKSNTAKVPLEALQMEVEVPLEAVQMEVDKPEACRHLASPVVLKPEVCAFHFVGVSSLPSKWKCPILMCF